MAVHPHKTGHKKPPKPGDDDFRGPLTPRERRNLAVAERQKQRFKVKSKPGAKKKPKPTAKSVFEVAKVLKKAAKR